LVLEHSDLSEITVHQEMETLNLYTSLEKLRFRDSFEVQITVNDDMEMESISIPPMLIQPHVENAIWHGLRHLEGDKRLTITVTDETEYLHVTIEDNGVGRNKAMEHKASRLGAEHRHTSKGLAICEQRIGLLQKQYPQTRMEIEDLYDKAGPSGTKVSLLLPIIPKSL
jgi:LytS/YehU family sensor histidine kinase